VAAEVMELARIKISLALKVPIEIVKARWQQEDGKMVPAFDVDMNQVKNMDEDQIRQSMGAIWRWLKDSLSERLDGLRHQRG
jgi:hypothetical protein